MPLADQHVSHLATVRVDAEPAQSPEVAVGGVDVVIAAFFYLSRRDDGDGFLLRSPRDHVALDDLAASVSPPRREQLHGRVIARHELRQRLLGGAEILELRLVAIQPDLAGSRDVHHVHRYEPGKTKPALRLDRQMGDRASGRVDDHADHLAPEPVGTANVPPD